MLNFIQLKVTNFPSLERPTRRPTEPTNICDQPKEIGPCRAAIPRWHYDPRSRSCAQFLYGGCQGNQNNFERQDECERRCGVVRRERPTQTPTTGQN